MSRVSSTSRLMPFSLERVSLVLSTSVAIEVTVLFAANETAGPSRSTKTRSPTRSREDRRRCSQNERHRVHRLRHRDDAVAETRKLGGTARIEPVVDAVPDHRRPSWRGPLRGSAWRSAPCMWARHPQPASLRSDRHRSGWSKGQTAGSQCCRLFGRSHRHRRSRIRHGNRPAPRAVPLAVFAVATIDCRRWAKASGVA